MNTWNTVISELANAQGHADQERLAHLKIQDEHARAKSEFKHSEAEIQSLEGTYADARKVLQSLEQEAERIEQETQAALGQSQEGKAHKLATEIASLHASVIANRADVNRLENTLLGLKGVLSQNRFNLFRLEQQMDTLSATTQLQQAQHKLAGRHGVRTALAAFSKWAKQPASNDANPNNNHSAMQEAATETPEAILARLKAKL